MLKVIMLSSYYIKLKKQPPEVFYKNAVLKYFAIFTGKNLCEIFKNISFEEHFRMALDHI